MRGPLLVILAAVLAAAGAAQADPKVGAKVPFSISPQVRATLRPAGANGYKVVSIGVATGPDQDIPTPMNETAEHMFQANTTFDAPAGTLVFSLWADAQHGARLKLQNASDHWVIYSAVIVERRDGRQIATTICSVPPGHAGFETWPDDLSAIRITGVFDAPSDGKLCGYADKGQLSAPPPEIPAPTAP